MDILNVISNRDIDFVYQSIYDLPTNKAIGAEALMRGPGNMNPRLVFDEAKYLGFCKELDYLCLQKSMEEAPKGITRLFINVYPFTLLWLIESKKIEVIKRLFPAEKVTLEIIEMENIKNHISHLIEAVIQLKRYGYSVAIDDISSGFDRLFLMASLKPEYIKLDRPFIKNLNQKNTQIIIKNLLNMARELNSIFIAEGIETLDELRRIRKLGIQFGQGFYLEEPSVIAIENHPETDCPSCP